MRWDTKGGVGIAEIAVTAVIARHRKSKKLTADKR
jgi:hypothetical protein